MDHLFGNRKLSKETNFLTFFAGEEVNFVGVVE